MLRSLLLIIVVSFVSVLSAQIPIEFTFSWQPWNPNLCSEIEIAEDILSGRTFSHEDLGIENCWLAGCFTINCGIFKRHYVNFTMFPLSYSGDAILDEEITFKGYTYKVNDLIHSEFSLSLNQIGYTGYPLIRNGFKLGVSAAVCFGIMQASIEDTILNERREYERDTLLPIVYLNVGYEHKYFMVGGKIGSFLESEWGTIFHTEILGEARPIPYVGIGLGFRHLNATWSLHDSKGEISFTGIFLQTSLRAALLK